MADQNYTIGEFAALHKISARMLRHYDEIGLLKPASVSAGGYRLYSSAQIPKVILIKKYRSCEFSLEEIRLLLEEEERLPELVQTKMQELRKQEAANAGALDRLYELSGLKKTVQIENRYEFSLTAKNARMLCAGPFCREEQIESEFQRLYRFVEEEGLIPAGLSMLLDEFHLDDSFRVAVPVRVIMNTEKYEFLTLEAGHYLSVFHFGDYDGIGMAYDALLKHIHQEGWKRTSAFQECYFLDRMHTASPSQYITEVSVKITP